MFEDFTLPEDKKDDEVDMAPMVDMVFLLLIFFMVASHLNQMEKVEIEVPTADRAKVPDEVRGRRTITIKADGTLYLGTIPATKEDIAPAVAKEHRLNPNLKIYIRADRRLHHEKVREVMEICAKAGAAEILFAAYEK